MFPAASPCCRRRPDSLNEALDLGISLYAGEAEGRFDEVLRDAAAGKLKPIYNYLHDLPGLEGATGPYMPPERVGRTIGMISSFDAGRGCPFLCSFCTIINVQGRKSRYRSADDIEALVRINVANGVRYFFITDDNLARNRNWESIFDRLIALRQQGIYSRFIIQVDTACHKIPRFIEKAVAAGVKRVFIGLENIDPDNLAAAKKKQNHISDYRELLLEWRKHRCITYCGYIIGFPNDTPESLVQRIQIIQRELPLDILEFSILTPLPGSEDHAKAVAKGVDIDPDLNKFDLEHVTTDHPRMSREEWQEAYRLAWRTYYTPEHIKTVIRRAVAGGPRPDTVAYLLTWFWASFHFYNIYPLETGMIRRRYRRDRRPGMPLENPLVFYTRHWGGQVVTYARILAMFAKIHLWTRRLERDPERQELHRRGATDVRRLRQSGNVPADRSGPAGGRQGEAHRGAQARPGACRRDCGGGEVGPALGLRGPRTQPAREFRQANPNKSKPHQTNPNKIAWFYLVLFVRIGIFQWVTANPNKIFLSRLSSRPGLWTKCQNHSSLLWRRRPRTMMVEFLMPSTIALILCSWQDKVINSGITSVPGQFRPVDRTAATRRADEGRHDDLLCAQA